MSFEVFCKCVTGAKHKKKDFPCEDYGIKRTTETAKIFVVADGHGDSNCIRSNIGSQLICDVACDYLDAFSKEIETSHLEEKLLYSQTEKLVRHLILSILSEWNERIIADYKMNPFSEEELSAAKNFAEDYREKRNISYAYGSTMIAGLLTEKYLLLLQQGDGRCDVFDSKGDVSQPIPWDDRCLGNATTSLCDEDVVDSCRFFIINIQEKPIIACIAGSDGVEDSFPKSMDKTHSYYRKILKYACENGIDSLEKHLEKELWDLSLNGSSDDVTVCGFIEIDNVKPFLNHYDEINAQVDLLDEIAIYDDRIRSVENGGKYTYLEAEYQKAKNALILAEREYAQVKEKCDSYIEKINDQRQKESVYKPETAIESLLLSVKKHKDSIDKWADNLESLQKEETESKIRLDAARDKFTKIESEFLPYKEKYDGYKEAREEAIVKLETLKNQTNN